MEWPSADDCLDDLSTLDMFGRPRCQEPTGRHTHDLVNWPATDDCLDDLSTLDLYGRPKRQASAGGGLTSQTPVEAEIADIDPEGLPPLAGTTEEHEPGLVTVANPQGNVSVSADMGGRIYRVELCAGVTGMREQELADEILVIAHLARQRARSAQYTLMIETLAETFVEDPESRSALLGFVTRTMNVATPEEAVATEAKVFATRYARC
ncbi:MAG: DUF2694 domain-containing protein [Mycobacterium pseudokansasii]|uniref:DUF2694 domain-containing protein n=1 Tax=Mycobacterium pseudokansasii TaxID=2341080 RepID=UPI0023F1B647|nr:DUF2694 domain-containing protein [Mycobacterium pseudokansasii]MBY0386921.1 DUF2694 domain-containing protein [Mycobacterium pseudokansasii]